MHTINIEINDDNFNLMPKEHRHLKFKISDRVNVLCKACQKSVDTVLKVSADFDNYKSPIIYINQYLHFEESV
jgi:hypothetical protein